MSVALPPPPKGQQDAEALGRWLVQVQAAVAELQKGYGVPQYASAPPYIKGAVYFDTTLNKLRVGGATSWETVTSA